MSSDSQTTAGTGRIQEMLAALEGARKEVLPSTFWEYLSKKNTADLESLGYDNFKRTVALNYFTWVLKSDDEQMVFLKSKLPKLAVARDYIRALRAEKHEGTSSALVLDKQGFTPEQSMTFNFLTYLIWDYASRNDPRGVLTQLDEPAEGNPLRIFLGKKLISQDLANSALEFNTVMAGVDESRIKTVLELGAGYGRTAFVFKKMLPKARVIVVDIPPALYVCERYFINQFPGQKVFRFRNFKSYSEIAAEFEACDIAFFLPNQMELLPEKIVDLTLNISSLHEMRPDQIRYYFDSIERLTRGYFYFKQWKVSKLPDDVTITEKDYPVRDAWRKVFWRECKVQTRFFEALYECSK